MIEQTAQGNHPLESIVQKIPFPRTIGQNGAPSGEESLKESPNPVTDKPLPRLTLAKLHIPSILINDELKIVWQNKLALEDIWHDTAIVHNESGHPSVFSLLFNANFQSMVENWRQWVLFFLEQGASLSSRAHLKELVEKQEGRCKDELRNLLSEIKPRDRNRILIRPNMRQFPLQGQIPQFRVITLDFVEGRLILFDPNTYNQIHARIDASFSPDIRYSEPVEKSVYFIAAQLNKAEVLRTEMLPNEYSQLLNLVWQKGIETFKQYGGVVFHADGNFLLGRFIAEETLAGQALTVIQCALELKSQMSQIGRQWRIRNGWLRQAEMNIGIHFSEEFIGLMNLSNEDSLTTFGNGLRMAELLSSIATDGEIWASKDLIKNLSSDALEHIRFGVYRSENASRTLVHHGFTRMKDLARFSPLPIEYNSEAFLSMIATQIFDTQLAV